MSIENQVVLRTKKWGYIKKGKVKNPSQRKTCGSDLEVLELDKAIYTDPVESKKRRTLQLVRESVQESWGFTVQSYGIEHKATHQQDAISYIDYVEVGSVADVCGLQAGDVILSINGNSVEDCEHDVLIQMIRTCKTVMRLVVLNETSREKVEASLRLRKLKKLLAAKLFELHALELQEKKIKSGEHIVDSSMRSYASSASLSLYHPTPLARGQSECPNAWAQSQFNICLDNSFYSRQTSTRSMMLPGSQSSFDVSLSVPPYLSCVGSQRYSTPDSSPASHGFYQTPPVKLKINSRLAPTYTSLPPKLRCKSSSTEAVKHVGRSTFYSDSDAGFTLDSRKDHWESSQSLVGNSTFYIGVDAQREGSHIETWLDSSSYTLQEEEDGMSSSAETLKNSEDEMDSSTTPVLQRKSLHSTTQGPALITTRPTVNKMYADKQQTKSLSAFNLCTVRENGTVYNDSSAPCLMEGSSEFIQDSGFESPVFIEDSSIHNISFSSSRDSGISNCIPLVGSRLGSSSGQTPVIMRPHRVDKSDKLIRLKSHSEMDLGTDTESVRSDGSGSSGSSDRFKRISARFQEFKKSPLPSKFRGSWESTCSFFRNSFMKTKTKSTQELAGSNKSSPKLRNHINIPHSPDRETVPQLQKGIEIYATLPKSSGRVMSDSAICTQLTVDKNVSVARTSSDSSTTEHKEKGLRENRRGVRQLAKLKNVPQNNKYKVKDENGLDQKSEGENAEKEFAKVLHAFDEVVEDSSKQSMGVTREIKAKDHRLSLFLPNTDAHIPSSSLQGCGTSRYSLIESDCKKSIGILAIQGQGTYQAIPVKNNFPDTHIARVTHDNTPAIHQDAQTTNATFYSQYVNHDVDGPTESGDIASLCCGLQQMSITTPSSRSPGPSSPRKRKLFTFEEEFLPLRGTKVVITDQRVTTKL